MGWRIAKEIKEEIIDKTQSGEWVTDLAAQYAVSSKTIYGWPRQGTGESAISMLEYNKLKYSLGLAVCAQGQIVRVAGQVVMHQAPPTAKGFHFITLEDEHGMVNVIVRPRVYTRYRRVLRRIPLLLVEGIVQREAGVVNLLCRRASPLPCPEAFARSAASHTGIFRSSAGG